MAAGDRARREAAAVSEENPFADELRIADEQIDRRRQRDRELVEELDLTERRIGEKREQTERAIEEAKERLDKIESQAGEAEARAARAEKLAELRQQEAERERRLQEMLARINDAEERAREAENRARAVERMREHLAFDVREPIDHATWAPSARLAALVAGGTARLGEKTRRSPEFLCAFAQLLDLFAACGAEVGATATRLGVTTGACSKLLLIDERTARAVNQLRSKAGLRLMR